LPPGAEAHVESLDVTGAGSTSFDLSRSFGTATMRSESEMNSTVRVNGKVDSLVKTLWSEDVGGAGGQRRLRQAWAC
jgi:hypothetical protein